MSISNFDISKWTPHFLPKNSSCSHLCFKNDISILPISQTKKFGVIFDSSLSLTLLIQAISKFFSFCCDNKKYLQTLPDVLIARVATWTLAEIHCCKWLASLLGQVSVSNIILTWTSHPTLIPCQLYMVLSFSVPFTVVLHYPLTISKCFLQCRESTIRIKTVGPFVYSTPGRWDDLSDWHVW